jgi:Domain of unknown function (DUF1839)
MLQHAQPVSPLPGLDPATYVPHALHSEQSNWREKNCYIDVWIELLHALQINPIPLLPFTIAIDFEGDQFTFFKPPHDELRKLYGIDVQELYVWRTLLDHAVEHLGAGKLISTEADAFWLPDTQGSDYRRKHTKTTIILANLDIDGQRLGYFHNGGYFSLGGEDFGKLFRLGEPQDPAYMPYFAEIVRVDGLIRRSERELAELSLGLLATHFERRPPINPITRLRERFERDLAWLRDPAQGLEAYHAWTFGTLRQLGAAFELAAEYLAWLAKRRPMDLEASIRAFRLISVVSKALVLKVARAVQSRREVDNRSLFLEMETAWADGMGALGQAIE